MQWLVVCLWAIAVATAQELRCVSPGCTESEPEKQWLHFAINGTRLLFSVKDRFYLNCYGYPALESPALPRFTSEYHIADVHIYDCPLPTNSSIGAALAAMNIVLKPNNGHTFLYLGGIGDTEQLEAHHFAGLEKLTNLILSSSFDRPSQVGPRAFTELVNLHTLKLRGFQIEAVEFSHFPPTVDRLELAGVSIKPLAGTLNVVLEKTSRLIPQLRTLKLYTFDVINYEDVTSNKTELQDQKTESSLEVIALEKWLERRLSPLQRCERLRKFELLAPSVEEIPDRFVAACPNLEELVIYIAEELKNLPSKFLEGATALKDLRITHTGIETLPAGLFQNIRNLVSLDLSDNKLIELPSGVFVGLPLQFLSLSNNQLNESALIELATLTSLTELKIQRNDFENPCEEHGYSPLQNLTKLKLLDLSNSLVKRICRDWRENMIYLEHLDLYGAVIRNINYNDLQYIRDPSVKNAVVSLVQSVGIIFSENDYKKALTAPATSALVKFENREKVKLAPAFSDFDYSFYRLLLPTCNCGVYWFRKAMDDASQAVRTEGYTCSGEKLLKDMKTEEFCPESERV